MPAIIVAIAGNSSSFGFRVLIDHSETFMASTKSVSGCSAALYHALHFISVFMWDIECGLVWRGNTLLWNCFVAKMSRP